MKINDYIPILQKAKENNRYLNLEHINLNGLLFLLKHGYIQRDDNGFILTNKAIFLIQEYEKKRGDKKKGGDEKNAF